MAVYFGRPSREMVEAPPGATVDRLAGWLIALKAVGVIPEEGRVIADIVGTLPILGRRPHTLVLLDATSREVRPGSHRLDRLQCALMIDREGMEAVLNRRVRDLLATYTDSEHGRIESVSQDGLRWHRLVDVRLPAWAVIEWGTVGRYFLVTIGEGAFEKMSATLRGEVTPLAEERWFARAHRHCNAAARGIELFVDIGRIRARLGEAVRARTEASLQAVHLEQADRILWTVGFDGRELRSEVAARENDGREYHVVLTGQEVAAREVVASIPSEADCFAAFRFPLAEVFRNGRQAYLESRSPGARQRLRQGWAKLEQEYAFDVESGLLDELGEHLIFHTYPPHPLGLPMLCTIWIQVENDRSAISDTIDRMMTAWQAQMNRSSEAADLASTRPSVILSPKIHHDADGIWYLQLGLLGPALAVRDGWIVISFSPQAVRQNLERLQAFSAQTSPSQE